LHPYPGTDATSENRGGIQRNVLKKWMTIAELGRLSGVGVETVRYYQRLGLVAVPSAQDAKSHRRYGADAVAELAFVRACKELGFSLKEIGVLVHLRRAPRSSCTRLHERLAELSAHLDAKERQLEWQRGAVRSLLGACAGGKPLGECEAFARLDQHDVGGKGKDRTSAPHA
jgi:MerR family copper efflux transcriptional regulator